MGEQHVDFAPILRQKSLGVGHDLEKSEIGVVEVGEAGDAVVERCPDRPVLQNLRPSPLRPLLSRCLVRFHTRRALAAALRPSGGGARMVAVRVVDGHDV